MGNALHAGDGLSFAEMSAVDSYSIGMTSESRTETDNTASVNTRDQHMRQQLTGTSDDRESGGGSRLHNKQSIRSRSSVSHELASGLNSNHRRPPGPMHNRPPRYETSYSREGKEGGRPRSPRSPRYNDKMKYGGNNEGGGPKDVVTRHDKKVSNRHDKKYSSGGDGSFTETSSAFHHGYDVRNESRDDQEDETYQEVGTYREYEGYEYKYHENNRINSYTSNIRSKTSGHHSGTHHIHQNQARSPTNNVIHIYDTTHHDESIEAIDRDGISTVMDIPPAESDMAAAGSEDEELAPENLDASKYRFEANRNTGMSNDHYATNDTEKGGPKNPYQVNEIEQEYRRGDYPYNETTGRDAQEPNNEQLLPEDDGINSVPGSSFSTLTKTLTTYVEDLAVFEKEQQRNLKNDIKKLKDAALEGTGDDNNDGDEANPAQRKLEELLQQQRLQEEKLQRQLEQLRIQKEKLQQLQEEKVRNSSRDSQSRDKSLQVPHWLKDQQDWALPSLNKKQIDVKPSGESIKNVQTSDSTRQERTRRERLAKARAKVMPLSPSRRAQQEERSKNNSKKSPGKRPDGAFNFDNIDTEVSKVDTALEEKYADDVSDFDEESSTGTATGEGEDSFVPEFEDVPSHCKLDRNMQEHDMTTISGSHFSNDLNPMSTVSSFKDRLAGVDEQEDGYDERLNGTFSMDDEIDLDFVAKYDKAFNAFLDKFPSLFDRNSELIQNLKVAKLQRILEVSYQTECALEAQLETPDQVKSSLEAEFQMKLKEASRQKAERSIQFRAELSHVKKETKSMEGELTWDMVQLSIKRANRLQKIKAELNSKELSSREKLLDAMPNDLVTEGVRKAMRMSPGDGSISEQKKELQEFKVNNAILASEVRVLHERVEALKEEAKKKEWVDSTLVRMDEKKLQKLKSRYQKKLGASF